MTYITNHSHPGLIHQLDGEAPRCTDWLLGLSMMDLNRHSYKAGGERTSHPTIVGLVIYGHKLYANKAV